MKANLFNAAKSITPSQNCQDPFSDGATTLGTAVSTPEQAGASRETADSTGATPNETVHSTGICNEEAGSNSFNGATPSEAVSSYATLKEADLSGASLNGATPDDATPSGAIPDEAPSSGATPSTAMTCATQTSLSTPASLRTIDLCCGCGGMSLGFQNAGFDVVAGYENWDKAAKCYEANFKHQVYRIDL